MAVRRGPVSYHEYKQRIRRYRRTDILRTVASLGIGIEQAALGQLPPIPPNRLLQGFCLAGLARTALASGNEHRAPRVLTVGEVEELCWYYVNVDDPKDGTPHGTEHLRQMMGRIAYEQLGSQLSPMEEISRSLVLFVDKAESAALPSQDEWRGAFGAGVVDLVNVGFVAHVAAMKHGGTVPVDHMGDSRFDLAYRQITPTEALAVLDRFYTAGIDDAAEWAAEQERVGYEKWSPNPLHDSPVIALADGTRIVPWPRALIARFSPSGLFYPAVQTFGSSFAEALGRAFESYVGDTLRLLRSADVMPERVWGKPESRSCDWFVVMPDCVLLVEVKATRPNVEVRLGTPEGQADVLRKIGKAADQLDRTAEMIRAGHPAVADIPADRPIVGLIATLEPFHFMDPFFYRDVLGDRSIPIGVAYAHMLEGTAATLADRTDAGRRILDALTSDEDQWANNGLRLDNACEGLDQVRSPILDRAWERVGPSRDAA